MGRVADHTHPSSAEAKKKKRYTSTAPLSLHSLFYGELYLYLLFVFYGKILFRIFPFTNIDFCGGIAAGYIQY